MATKDGSSGDSRRGLPAGRLPSLKGRQDLTLGGVPKRTFAPVIPVKKDRSKIEVAVEPAQNVVKRESVRGARGHDFRGRGRGRGQDNYVQMKGIFEEVSREPIRSRSNYTASSRAKSYGGDAGDSVKPENMDDISDAENDEEDSKDYLASLKRDDFVEYDHLETKDTNMTPVFLSKSVGHACLKTDGDLKKDMKVKNEIVSDDENMDTCSKIGGSKDLQLIKSDKKMILSEEKSSLMFTKELDAGIDNFFLIQLPDVLPGKPPAKDLTAGAVTLSGRESAGGAANKHSKSAAAEQETGANSFSLSNFSEGRIGKLQIRKSGRTQLVLGEVVLNIDAGVDLGVLLDLVSINVTDKTSGDMSVLGHVKHKFICIADFESLLDSAEEMKR